MAIDPIIKDHQLWIGFVQPEGLVVSPHALKSAQAVLSHNVGVQQEILRRHTVPDIDSNLRLKNFSAFTKEFWGWRESDLATPPDDLSARLPEYGETLRPAWVVRGGEGQPEHLILLEELPWGTDFDKAVQQSEEHRWHASPQARFERLLRETGVSIGLLVSPGQIRLVYAPKGESSGHVTFPIHQMTMVPNWPMLAALHLLLHSDRLFIGPENQRLPAILEASRRYQNEVSIRLAGQVLRALNELVRGFQEADRAAHGILLGEALRHDPNHIYGGMLTTLMRMVFVLYAEDRSLMGSDETWLQNYSISGLYGRLRADAGQYPDTMDSRFGAWAQIITLTRLLYDGGGHGSWRLPPRHGGLFDPDAFPFLEGRPRESKRAATALVEPPLVSDGILFRILQDLLYLEGERISYRALDVEQIGSVYEAMMGFTVETAHGISIGLGAMSLRRRQEPLRRQPGQAFTILFPPKKGGLPTRALDRGLAEVTVALSRQGWPGMTKGPNALRAMELRSTLSPVVDVFGRRVEQYAALDSKETQQRRDSVRGKVEDLLDDWAKISKQQKDSGASLRYQQYDDGTGPYLLRYPLDPDLERLESKAAQFKAHRSLRDVEPACNLRLIELNGNAIEPEEDLD